MRHYIVLGFTSQFSKDSGEPIYIGCEREKALKAVNTSSKEYVRRELYDLAVPVMRRIEAKATRDEASKAAKKAAKEAAKAQAETE